MSDNMLEDSQVSPARPSDAIKLKLKTVKWEKQQLEESNKKLLLAS